MSFCQLGHRVIDSTGECDVVHELAPGWFCRASGPCDQVARLRVQLEALSPAVEAARSTRERHMLHKAILLLRDILRDGADQRLSDDVWFSEAKRVVRSARELLRLNEARRART